MVVVVSPAVVVSVPVVVPTVMFLTILMTHPSTSTLEFVEVDTLLGKQAVLSPKIVRQEIV